REDVRWLRGLAAPEAALTLAAAAADTGGQVRQLLDRMAAAAHVEADSAVSLRPVEARLRDRWRGRGHLTATVTLRGDTLRVAPGPVWTVGAWDVTGDDFPGRDHLLDTWLPRPGEPFRPAEIERAIARVLAGTGEAGHPFARWVSRGVESDTTTHAVRVLAMLIPGQAARLGPITSDLPTARGRRFLARASGLGAGEPFRHSDLARAVERLYARDLYAALGEPQVYTTTAPDTVGVHFPVVPRTKVNRLQVVLGLSRRDEGGSRLSGEVDLRLPNMGGSGRKLQVGWRDDGQDRSRFGFSYLEPLAFGTGLDMGLAVDNEVQRDVYTRFRIDNTWNLPVVALWGVELGFGWDRTTYPVGALERTGRVRASGAVEHRRGDRSRSGWEGIFGIETAWRSATARTDSSTGASAQLGEASTQRILRGDLGGEWWVGGSLSLFGRASFRQLTGGERDVPLSEQFRFGGANSLRGYREDEFHGRQAAWGAVEARIGRPRGSRLYAFYDLGYYEFWTTDPAAADPGDLLRRRGWPRGYGLGIFARTPGGDISLAVGFPGTVDFDQAKLHVTLLETF
ncbi:BamA/TamA family outer membrane protein, partial [bacterium]|nr:BamA/TamA family outer membrane protein [bacterium]